MQLDGSSNLRKKNLDRVCRAYQKEAGAQHIATPPSMPLTLSRDEQDAQLSQRDRALQGAL